jgi:hypothetical protein
MAIRTDEDGFREWLAARGLTCPQGDEVRDLQAQRERVACLEQAVAYVGGRIEAGDKGITIRAVLADYRARLSDAYAVLVNIASRTP